MKKILAILLVVVMSLSMITPVFAGRYSDTVNNDYEAAIKHLSGLGVIDGYEDGSYQPEKIVTRAEMAKLLVTCLGLDLGVSLLEGQKSFDDVPTNHWASGFIGVAEQYKLIRGDGDGNFRPEDTVNYAEAATMCLRTLGYSSVVDDVGQWPTNYLNKADELRLFEEINITDGKAGATRGTVAQLMWNMINTKMWVIDSENKTNGVNYKEGEKMITLKYPKYKLIKGVFNDYDIIDGKTFDLTIDPNTSSDSTDDVKVRLTDISPLSIYNEGKDLEVLYVNEKIDGEKVNVSESLYIDSTNVVTGVITKKSTDQKEITVNGKIYKSASTITETEDDLVRIVLDNSGKISAIEKYTMDAGEFIVVKSLKDATNGKKTTYTHSVGKSFDIDNDDKQIMYITLDNQGNSELLSKADIKEGSVVEVYDTEALQSNKLYFVTNKTVSGEISKMVDGKFVIDNNSYIINANAKVKYETSTALKDLDATEQANLIGENVILTLNALGEVIYAESKETTSANNYGFIVEAWSERVNNVLTHKAKIVNVDGTTTTYETFDFDAAVNDTAAIPTAIIATGDYVEGSFKATVVEKTPLVKYVVKDGKLDIDEIKKADTTIIELGSSAAIANDLNDIRKTIKDKIVTSDTKFITFGFDSNHKYSVVKSEFDDLKVEESSEPKNLRASKIVLEKDGSNKIAYVVIERDTVVATQKFAVIQSAQQDLANSTYKVSLFDIETAQTVEVELTSDYNIVKSDIGDIVTYSIANNGKYSLTLAPSISETLVEANTDNEITTEAGVGYTSILLTGPAKLDVKNSEVKVIFITDDGVASVGTMEDIREGYKVAGLEEVSTSDTSYKLITVREII